MSERLVAGLLGVTVFGLYAAGAAATPHLLDSAELVAASWGLGIAHPPGEVLSLLWIRAWMLLPLGSLAFRAALAQAAAGALAVVLVQALARHALRELCPRLPAGRGPSGPAQLVLAVAAALAFAGAPGVVNASVRPEVYALATALALAALYCALEARARAEPRLALLSASLIGLGLANHPLVAGTAALAAVVAAWPLAFAWPRGRAAPVAGAAAGTARGPATRRRLLAAAPLALLVGLAPLVYLPARSFALHGAEPDTAAETLVWGDARTPAGLLWILSARTFAAKAALVHGRDAPWALPFLFVEELSLPVVLLALVGLYGLARLGRLYALALTLLTGALAVSSAALAGGLDPSNPDIRGYLGGALALLCVLGAAGTATALALVPPRAQGPAAGLLLVLTAAGAALGTARDDLGQARAAHRLTHRLLADLPLRAVLLTTHFETGFLVAHHRLLEGARPDVTWAHLGWVGGPGAAARLGRARPELAALLDRAARGPLPAAALQDLAERRPVFVEPGVGLLDAPGPRPRPAGWTWQIDPNGGARGAADDLDDLAPSAGMAPRFLADDASGWRELRAEWPRSRELRGYVGFRLLHDARWACDHGHPRGPALAGELREILPEDLGAGEMVRRCGESR